MKIKHIYLLTTLCLLQLFTACSNDNDPDLSFVDGIPLPSNISLQIQLSQDNSGLATITPSGESAASFVIDFGDGSISEPITAGNNVSHIFTEGTFDLIVTAQNLNGETASYTESLVVSFLPPENLSITVTPVSGDNFSIDLSAEADFAVGFEVLFGDDPNEVPTPFGIGENASHTYSEVGTYTITVTAFSGATQSIQGTAEVIIENPITLPIDFESETLDYAFIDFAGAINTIIDNPDPSGVNTSAKVTEFFKETGAEVFAGTVIELGAPIDFTQFQSFKLDSWSPTVGTTVKLKIENASNASISAEIDATTTVANGWETLYFDFSSADLSQEYSKVVIFFEFGNIGSGTTYYYDNIAQGIAPGNAVELPLDFENSSTVYNIIGFEGADSFLETNPFQTGINTSPNIIRTTKTVGAQFFAGTAIPLDAPIDFSGTQSIRMKTYSPKADIPVRLKLENSNGDFVELDVNTTVENEWEELVWDFSGMNTNFDFTTVVVFFEFIVDLPGDGSTYYFDDVELAN